MATLPVIDDLDRCKIALQYVAEMQPDRLTNVFDLLLERLDMAIGQAHAQLRQCQCLRVKLARGDRVGVEAAIGCIRSQDAGSPSNLPPLNAPRVCPPGMSTSVLTNHTPKKALRRV